MPNVIKRALLSRKVRAGTEVRGTGEKHKVNQPTDF